MKSIFRKRYRIVTDNYAGYEVQVKTWYWPFWIMYVINTHVSIRQAEEFIKSVQFKQEVVKYYED